MITYEIDPSLFSGEPEPEKLDDGFSRPQPGDDAVPTPAAPQPALPILSEKSDF